MKPMKSISYTLWCLLLVVLLVACHPSETTEANSTAATTPVTTDITKTTAVTDPSQTAAPPDTAIITTTIVTTTVEVTYEEIPYDTTPTSGENGTPYSANWNPYLLSPLIPEEYETAFHAAIKAILNHRRTVTFSSLEELLAVRDNLFYEFPPSSLATWTVNTDTLTLHFTYLHPRDEHLKKLQAFRDAVEGYLEDNLLFGDSEAEKAILLYHAISYSIDYFSVDYTHAQTNAFYALTEKKALCYSFSDAYNYLLRQVGMEAILVKGYRSTDRADHGWSLVKIDGAYYHCDATWESSMCSGAGLYYFGLSDEKRARNIALDHASAGDGNLKITTLPTADDHRFLPINGDKFRYPDWTLDRGNNTILYRGKKYVFSGQ